MGPVLLARPWTALLVVSSVAWGCSGRSSHSSTGTSVGSETAVTSSVDAADALRTFGADTQAGVTASFGAVEAEVRKDPSALRDAAIPLIDAPDPSVRFAAIYALSLTADNASSRRALEPVLASGDVSERLLAAEAMLRGGDESALSVVIDALSNDSSMELWEPPMPVWRFARLMLLGATGLDFGLQSAQTLDDAVVAKRAWEHWWRTSGSTYQLPAAGPAS